MISCVKHGNKEIEIRPSLIVRGLNEIVCVACKRESVLAAFK